MKSCRGEVLMPVIEFIGPAALANDGDVVFRARGEGTVGSCRFTQECLEDVDPKCVTNSPLERFEKNRTALFDLS